MESRARRLRWPVYLAALLAFCLASVALREAVIYYGRPIAGVLVVPDGTVSNTGLPTWSGIRKGLRFPDRIVEVEGHNITQPAPNEYPAVAFDRAVAEAAVHGRRSVSVKVETADGLRALELDLEPLGPLAWWTYAGVMFFAGGLYVIAALIAMWAGRGSAARTFSKLAVFGSLVLFTFFDFHTTRLLAPLFWLAQPMLPMAF